MGKYNTRCAMKRMQRQSSNLEKEMSNVADKKRKVSKTSVEPEKVTKRMKKTSNTHDSYCWKCHQIGAEIECSTCPRAFHSECVKKMKEDRICEVCQEHSLAKETSSINDETHLSRILLHIVESACPMDEDEYKPLIDWPDSEENDKLICKKDFRFIYDRCMPNTMQYESLVELFDDVQWILHNCIIIFGVKSPKIVDTAKKVLNTVKLEKNDALDCPECYYMKMRNEAYTFLNICRKPHPLVWAKLKFQPYWPAKCLKVLSGKAHVRFFGTHQMAIVKLENVFTMSEEYPSKNKPVKADFETAMVELEAYIDAFKTQYGLFPYRNILDTKKRFDFEKEESILKNLLENYSRRVIVEDKSPKDKCPIVDLTDDTIEDDENQSIHSMSPHNMNDTQIIIDENQLTGKAAPYVCEADNLFENHELQINHLHTIDANHNSNEYVDAAQPPITDEVLNDAELRFDKLGFNLNDIRDIFNPSHENSNNQSSQPPQQLLEGDEPISGSLLPFRLPSTDHHQNFLPNTISSSTGISISNVTSGTGVPTDRGNELFECHSGTGVHSNFIMNRTTEADILSSSKFQSLKNYDRTSETAGFSSFQRDVDDDIEVIEEPSFSSTLRRVEVEGLLRAIFTHDPKLYSMLNKANSLVQDLFIQFWGMTNNLNPQKLNLVESQTQEINSLKVQIEDMRKQISHMKQSEDRIKNADKIIRSLKTELDKLKKDFNIERKMYEKELSATEEREKKRYEEKLKDAKITTYCSFIDCNEHAKFLCCHTALRSYAYCSEYCKNKDFQSHINICKSLNSNISKPEDGVQQQSVSVVNVSYSRTVETVQNSSVQKRISINEGYPVQQQGKSSATAATIVNKVVEAKKTTLELAKNVSMNSGTSNIF